ncbi:MAG: DUF4328 domain-containing protein, partial [Myxococcota bacterium]
GPAAAAILEAKWANACVTTGAPRTAAAPKVAGTAAGAGWRLTVIAMPPSAQPGDPVFMAVVEGGAAPALYFYERCLAADQQRLAPNECVVASQVGDTRNNFGTFTGLSLQAFVAALGNVLGVPGLQVQPTTATAGTGRSLPSGGAAAGLLLAVGVLPLVSYGLGFAGVFIPFVFALRPLLGLAAIIVTLVWLHGTFVALNGRTKMSPGMAVGGWFIPVANLVLPALALRDAWRASVGGSGVIAFAWMFAWWSAVVFSVLGPLDLTITADIGMPAVISLHALDVHWETGVDIDTVGHVFGASRVLVPAVAYGLLAAIVTRISGSGGRVA